MRLRLKHTWGFMFLVAVYAFTEVCVADEKEMLYAKLDSGLDFWISATAGTHSLSWATSMLPPALRELATSYALVPMALEPIIPTPLLLNFA